ncbi:MAG: aminomethyl-transferring glycine dehydrogenase subunit GcvPB, partial [Candidatus Rokubacteria bacterium]|nr:aminomethyl-transferring glycine dehydrogenase subunit GcvPB [Candidatus Rokubacteria bacterium]
MRHYDKLIFELSSPGRVGYSLPEADVPVSDPKKILPSEHLRGAPPELPEVSELDVIRHYSRLSQLNYGVDTHFYPLGSCTMKYNPKVTDAMAALPGMQNVHPLQPEETVQGAVQLMFGLQEARARITGFDAVSFAPAAGAHGELAG